MSRKSKQVREEAVKAAEKFREMERLLKEAEEEEKATVEGVEKQIQEIAAKNGMFCGVVLTTPDLLTILEMALKMAEPKISIPFKLYYNE